MVKNGILSSKKVQNGNPCLKYLDADKMRCEVADSQLSTYNGSLRYSAVVEGVQCSGRQRRLVRDSKEAAVEDSGG